MGDFNWGEITHGNPITFDPPNFHATGHPSWHEIFKGRPLLTIAIFFVG